MTQTTKTKQNKKKTITKRKKIDAFKTKKKSNVNLLKLGGQYV